MIFFKNKKLLSFLVFSFFIFAFFKISFVNAAPNVLGKAVLVSGSTVYWVIFDKTDCDSNSNDYIDTNCGGDLNGDTLDNDILIPANYGVIIDGTGIFSGKVWYYEPNLKAIKGWIDFDTFSGCPNAPCDQVTLASNGQISGWARITDGLSNWVNFSGTIGGQAYQVYNDDLASPNEFRGKAFWGFIGVSGFLFLNNIDCTGITIGGVPVVNGAVCPSLGSYKVTYTSTGGSNPIVTIDPPVSSPCVKSWPDEGKVSISWNFNKPGDVQNDYEIQIDTDPSFSNIDQDSHTPLNSVARDCIFYNTTNNTSAFITRLPLNIDIYDCSRIQIEYNQVYYWRIMARGTSGNWSDWANGVTLDSTYIPVQPYPYVEFVPPNSPRANSIENFIDNSTCYYAGVMVPCLSANYSWDFNEGDPLPTCNPDFFCQFLSTQGDVSHKYVTAGDYWAYLEINDGGNICSSSSLVRVEASFKPPVWIEITPF